MRTKIEQIKAEPVRNPPAKVYEWDYNGTKYYYISAHCCDIPSQLFDKDCNLICAPDGGFTGKGDGKCPDFDSNKLTKRLIWEDNRHLSEKSKVKSKK
ncbi:hypothetical protein FW774_11630 [Pedobacter sp. BS3]|nr:hypothetical protein FW774_11630 [Pedobacter sp. BS3]